MRSETKTWKSRITDMVAQRVLHRVIRLILILLFLIVVFSADMTSPG